MRLNNIEKQAKMTYNKTFMEGVKEEMINKEVKPLFSSDEDVCMVMNLLILLGRNKIHPTAEIVELYKNYEGSNDAFIREVRLDYLIK